MRKVCLTTLLLMFAALHAFAGNWYVNKAASGSNNGADWNNAWNEMNQINFSSVACGDTIWIAGGTYTTQLAINKTCTSGTVLNINRVLSTDSVPTAAAGWNSSYDRQVVISNAEIVIDGGAYYTINGREGTPASNNLGISVRCTGGGGCNGMDGAGSGNLSNITISYVELSGPACVTSGGSGEGSCGGNADGFNVAPSNNNVTNLTLDHMWIHNFAELVRTSNWTNCTIQYSDLDTTRQTPEEHEDVVYSYPNVNFTMRYNIIYDSPNDGIFFDFGGSSLNFYGNVYLHSGAALISFKAGYSNGAVVMYNNTFSSDETFGDYICPGNCPWIGWGSTSSAIVENNIFDHVTFSGSPGGGTHDYNAYSSDIGKQDSGTNSLTYSSAFGSANTAFMSVNTSSPVSSNFRLTSTGATTFQSGVTLSSPYNTDPDGNARGSNGHWYMGAYQYGGTQAAQAPNPPTGLSAAVQ